MSASTKFAPRSTPETEPFWAATAAGRLDIQRCLACHRPFFYPRTSCPHCGGVDLEWFTCSGRARLHSYVISHRPAPGFGERTIIAVVELEEGPRMLSNIVGVDPDPDLLPLELPLRVVFEDRDGVRIPLFTPTEAHPEENR